MPLWLQHSFLDGVGDALKAAIAPKPRAQGEIGSRRCAYAVVAVTPGACCPRNLAMENLLAKRHLLARCSWGYRQTGIRMNALGRKGVRRSFGFDSRSGCGLDPCRIRVADIGHTPNAASLVVGDVKRAVRSHRYP